MLPRPRALAALVMIAGTVSLAVAGTLSSSGPDASHTGAPAVATKPAEFNCSICHLADWDNVNTPGGAIEILDLPANYTPGQTYPLRIRIHSDSTAFFPGHEWGFQITAVRASDGEGCGTFLVDPDTLRVRLGEAPFDTREYAEQGANGIRDGLEGPIEWNLAWRAPAGTEGTVLLYCAGVAANDSHDPGGDLVFTSSATLADATTPARSLTWGSLKARFR